MSVIFFITVKITPILLLYMETYLVWSSPCGRYLQTSVSRSNFTAPEDRFRLPCDEQAIRYLIGLRPQNEEIVTLLNFHNQVGFTQGHAFGKICSSGGLMDMFGAVEELIEFESVAHRGAPDVDILCASLDSVYWEILTYTFDFLCCFSTHGR